MSICLTMDCQTNPCEASSGVLGSPLMPSTARTVSPTGLRLRPNRMTVGVPWPGMYAPDVSMTCVRSIFGKELLDQLLAKLPLHERVGRNHADVAAAAVVFARLDRQFPEPLSERHAKRVLPMAGAVQVLGRLRSEP